MKTSITIFLFIAFLLAGCSKNEVVDVEEPDDDPKTDIPEPKPPKELTDGFCLVLRDSVIFNHNDFEYYDYSAHLVYMKDHMSFVKDIQGNGGEFKVYANKEVIYKGETYPLILSRRPFFPVVILTWFSSYADYLIPLEYSHFILTDSLGNVLPDPRSDERIVSALKKYNQFRAGLTGEIKSVSYSSPNDVTVELLLHNNDSINYWYLDPDKMGIRGFNYITNGLYLRDLNSNKFYTHKVGSNSPGGSTWKDWVSLIRVNESKVVTIHYDSFEAVPNGNYKATFQFPGSWKVEKNELNYNDSRVWMGKLDLEKEITIE